uniref:hypothetical protein n=1 Tax=Streptosporangium sp. CA-235898 TaxID=3240073 RepID=UPI003F4985EF
MKPVLYYGAPASDNHLVVNACEPPDDKAAVLTVASRDRLDMLTTAVAAADLDTVVAAMYKAAGRDVVITDRVAEIEPGAWRGGGGTARVSNGAVCFNHDRIEWDMNPDAAEQMGAALILAARATRRRPPQKEVRALAESLARRDVSWDLVEPGDQHMNMAEGILTDFTLTPREDV